MENWLYLEPLRAYLADYLRQRGLSTKKPFSCLNPNHEDKHPSMSFNARANNLHCFACGINYDLFDLIGMDYNISDFAGQYEKACELFGFEPKLPKKDISSTINSANIKNNVVNKPQRRSEQPCPTDRTDELKRLEGNADRSLEYFKSRGITAESCKLHRFFQMDSRAYMPVFDGEKCVGWAARAIDDETEPRYKNSSGPLGIWNFDLLRENGAGKCVYVTEGIIDAVILEQMGHCAIALCGSQNTAKLLRMCGENMSTASTWRFILAGDPDDAGQKMNTALKTGLEKLGFSCGDLILPQDSGDVNELYLKNPDKLRKIINEAEAGKGNENDEAASYALTSAASALDNFFEERQRRAGRSGISTGFSGMDKLLDGGLYSGLYILGAISSLGKTSFILQMADYISENECDCLFFSLEQSRFELMAKSISRTSAVLDGGLRRNAFTARQLLSGMSSGSFERDTLLADAREIYAKSAAGMFIREGMADIGVSDIREAVREHISMRGTKPVVFVDYLQILSPSETRATDKQNTDRAVVELKRISRDFDIPVVAVSSFNRENYRAAVSMEAFKESGAVEYSADVLFGLQLKGAGDRDFDVNVAKSKEPRQVELVMLKNRNGIPYAKLNLDYDARFSLFLESAVLDSKVHVRGVAGRVRG